MVIFHSYVNVYHWVISEISPKSTFFLAQQHQGIMDLVECRTVVARVPWHSIISRVEADPPGHGWIKSCGLDFVGYFVGYLL